jgi:hypothetical protein
VLERRRSSTDEPRALTLHAVSQRAKRTITRFEELTGESGLAGAISGLQCLGVVSRAGVNGPEFGVRSAPVDSALRRATSSSTALLAPSWSGWRSQIREVLRVDDSLP